jgi:hypothetical protein
VVLVVLLWQWLVQAFLNVAKLGSVDKDADSARFWCF